MSKIFITKSQLEAIILKEHNEQENYMFFSNLEQIERQCKLLRNIGQDKINKMLTNGHDWADDLLSGAKQDIDHVFDFIMNEVNGADDGESRVNANPNEFSLNEGCWGGYKSVGSKIKNGKMVPNCVPINEAKNLAQQAAIAINMKKHHKKPKNESEKEMYEAMEIDESKNKPTNPKLWASSLAWARSKYDVCPSAYCNGAAAKHYKSKGGGWRKCK